MGTILEQVPLGKPEIDNVDFGRFFTSSYDEIIWFDISMKIALIVDKLNPLNHLISNH